MIKKIADVLMLLALFACLVIPCALMNNEKMVFSEYDNRFLRELPEKFDSVKEHNEEVEAYLMDRIAFRNELISLHGVTNSVLFADLSDTLYEYGLEGHAFFAFEEEEADMEYLTDYADYVASMNRYCIDRGVPFVYVNTPDKKHVYSQFVPDYVPAPLNNFEYLAPLLEEREVPYIDLGDALRAAYAGGNEVFHRVYDVGHWNSEGALVGAQTIISYLQSLGFNVEQPDLKNDYKPVMEHHDYLPASAVYYPIDTYKYLHKENGKQAVNVTDQYDPLNTVRFHTYNLWESPNCGNDLNLLMFQGSYFNTQGTVLYNQFARTECIHAYENIFNIDEYFNMFNPDIVVFESADYVINGNYYSPFFLQQGVLSQQELQWYGWGQEEEEEPDSAGDDESEEEGEGEAEEALSPEQQQWLIFRGDSVPLHFRR